MAATGCYVKKQEPKWSNYKERIYEVCSQRYAYMDYTFETFPVRKRFFFTCHQQDCSRRVSQSVHSRSSHMGILSLSVPGTGCPWDQVWLTVELGPWMLGRPPVYSLLAQESCKVKDKEYTPLEVYKSIARLIS